MGEMTFITETDMHQVSAGEMLSTEEGWVGSCPRLKNLSSQPAQSHFHLKQLGYLQETSGIRLCGQVRAGRAVHLHLQRF